MSRRWRWLGRAVLVGLLVGGLHYADTLWTRYDTRAEGQRRLREAEHALDQSDPGWRLTELVARANARVPTADQNLTDLCLAANDRLPKPFVGWANEWRLAATKRPVNRLPDADSHAAAQRVWASAEPAVTLARTVRDRAAGGRRCVPEADPLRTLLPQGSAVMAVAALLDLDAELAANAGDWPRAVAAVERTLHSGRALAEEPFEILQLLRIRAAGFAAGGAERTLAWGEPPASLLAGLQAELLAEADQPRLDLAFRSARAMYHAMFTSLDAGRTRLADIGGYTENLDDKLGEWHYKAYLPGDQAYSLEFHSRLVAVSRLPTHDQVDGFDQVERPDPGNPWTALSRLILPLLDQLPGEEWRTRARLRSAAVGLACERFRQANGCWPADLAELKELLPTVPPDPYDGQPLRYRKLDDGVVVYAVGPDRQDDGGALSYGNPQPGEDVGFRLWDVAARRQPADGD